MDDKNVISVFKKKKKSKCPICKKNASKQSHPFCSSHCANLDLSRWFNGQYSIASFEESPEKENIDLIEED